ncbi:MAG: helicase-related protein, partial [Candidatus Methylumidiphilus sp.]
MPRIFDNIEKSLLPALIETIDIAYRADFCVGYFNLRGWRPLAGPVDRWPGGEGKACRLLVGMPVTPTDELRQILRAGDGGDSLDNPAAIREKKRIAEDFRRQLTFGIPSNPDESTLRQLAAQLRAKKLIVKVYLRHPLHAKLYLLHRNDPINPIVGYLGSSNLTLAGLSKQGELNMDVLDGDACDKLAAWFEARWHDRWCIDISKELAEIIEQSWAGETLVPPYHVYLKMAYHLAQEARTGLSEFDIPPIFADRLFGFQTAAVKIAAHHLNKRGGVLIGDVVGLGKSMMATALVKLFEDDYHTETLIICPKNLVSMWEDYAHRYKLHAKVLPLSKVINELPEKTRRFRVVLIDESHNLRNKEGKRYRAIREYIERNESLCILLSATPYNKTYLDLSAQLALFLKEDTDLGIRPEKLLNELGGESEFIRRHQCPIRSLAAFEKSTDTDDWRDLMRLYMVRRTRGFIMQNYATEDPESKRRYLVFADGSKSYFPARIPKNLSFKIQDDDPNDPYARFYSAQVVDAINALKVPRYGLGGYLVSKPQTQPTPQQAKLIEGLSRAGKRLMGFCRTNLFKRLESAGPAFLLSIERHILRNFVFLRALDNGLDIPLGTQGAELLDTRYYDEDPEDAVADEDEEPAQGAGVPTVYLRTEADFYARAAEVYASYASTFKKRFKWLPGSLFTKTLGKHLLSDARALIKVLDFCGDWNPSQDTKLAELARRITQHHRDEKILIFTQFADTARYLQTQLAALGVQQIAEATGQSADPTELAWRFSPESNGKRHLISEGEGEGAELRVLIATDVLSEGQNLQDCAIIVNYDLPWAIIRLIQRAGRVDRIGQRSDRILCYSFVPADGVERLLSLRARVRQRLIENREVVGSDEAFFDDDRDDNLIRDLYTERNGILDDDGDNEVDLASYAYQIWKNATDADPTLVGKVEALPNVVYATKAHTPSVLNPK